MKKITCQFCLQPTAVLTVRGELTDLYTCGHCAEAFDLDHLPYDHSTEASPQRLALPAAGGLNAIEAGVYWAASEGL